MAHGLRLVTLDASLAVRAVRGASAACLAQL
jgi:hypothetical protein